MAGLEVAGVGIGTAGSTRYLQVLRYDRKSLDGGLLERIHQEDFCQALGIPPALKYQQEGGPNLKQCFGLVRSISAVPGPDVLHLFDAGVGPSAARKRLEGFARNVGRIVRGMDESQPGWKMVSPVILANCSRLLSI